MKFLSVLTEEILYGSSSLTETALMNGLESLALVEVAQDV